MPDIEVREIDNHTYMIDKETIADEAKALAEQMTDMYHDLKNSLVKK